MSLLSVTDGPADRPAGDAGDISGVPATQLQRIFLDNLDTDLTYVAERIEIDLTYLKRILGIGPNLTVIDPVSPVIKMGMADKILLGIGRDVAEMIHRDELAVVPLRGSTHSAKKIADEEVAVAQDLGLPVPTHAEVQERIQELIAEYEEHCQLTETQRARREADWERVRTAREKRKNQS